VLAVSFGVIFFIIGYSQTKDAITNLI